MSFYEYIGNNSKLPRNLKVLTDASNASYEFDIDEAEQLIEFLKECLKSYNSLVYAFIHKTPKETAYSQLLAAKKMHPNHQHKLFIEKENALKWLKNHFF